MKTLKVDTWLPVFSGFYETIWETDSDEEFEIECINEKRHEQGLDPIDYDAIEWNYDEYENRVAEDATKYIEKELKQLGLVSSCKFQKVYSPREYNFVNDSIHVSITLNTGNRKNIAEYLHSHQGAFIKYVKYRYTSCAGFISFHSNDAVDWLNLEETLADTHTN